MTSKMRATAIYWHCYHVKLSETSDYRVSQKATKTVHKESLIKKLSANIINQWRGKLLIFSCPCRQGWGWPWLLSSVRSSSHFPHGVLYQQYPSSSIFCFVFHSPLHSPPTLLKQSSHRILSLPRLLFFPLSGQLLSLPIIMYNTYALHVGQLYIAVYLFSYSVALDDPTVAIKSSLWLLSYKTIIISYYITAMLYVKYTLFITQQVLDWDNWSSMSYEGSNQDRR